MAEAGNRPASTPEANSDEYDRFEQTLRILMTVPKPVLDAAIEQERQERAKAHPSARHEQAT